MRDITVVLSESCGELVRRRFKCALFDLPLLVVDGVNPMSQICRTFAGVVTIVAVSTSPEVLERRDFFATCSGLRE